MTTIEKYRVGHVTDVLSYYAWDETKMTTVTLFDECRDNNAGKSTEMKWYEFAEILMKEHNVVTEKDGTMFNGMVFKDNRGDGWIRRCRKNVEAISLLILDYDGDETIDDVKERFKQYEYVGYTSFSHKTEGKGGRDCFRLVFPIWSNVSLELFESRREDIRRWAGDIDVSSTDISRGFYSPSCTEENLDKAERWHNEGWVVEIQMFEKNKEKTYKPEDFESVEITDADLWMFKEALMKTSLNNEPKWMTVMRGMKTMGFSEADFIECTTVGSLMSQKSAEDCRSKWRHNSSDGTVTQGSLIHLIRENGDPTFLKSKKMRSINKQIFKIRNKEKT